MSFKTIFFKSLTLIFTNNIIDCSKANIIVTNQYRQPIFNLCQDGLAGIRYESYFLIVHLVINDPNGSITTDMNLSIDNLSGQTTTQAPPTTTTSTTKASSTSTSGSSSLSLS